MIMLAAFLVCCEPRNTGFDETVNGKGDGGRPLARLSSEKALLE